MAQYEDDDSLTDIVIVSDDKNTLSQFYIKIDQMDPQSLKENLKRKIVQEIDAFASNFEDFEADNFNEFGLEEPCYIMESERYPKDDKKNGFSRAYDPENSSSLFLSDVPYDPESPPVSTTDYSKRLKIED